MQWNTNKPATKTTNKKMSKRVVTRKPKSDELPRSSTDTQSKAKESFTIIVFVLVVYRF